MDTLTLIFKNILNTCIISSIMILFIMIVKSAVKNKISANIIYFLFLLLLIRLIFPFSIQSKVSIENLYHKSEVVQSEDSYNNINLQVDHSDISKDMYIPITENREKAYRFFTYVWIFGIFAIMFIPIVSYVTLKKELLNEKNPVNDIVIKASVDARTHLDITTRFRVVYSYYLDAPALIGVLKPMIVLPMSKKDSDYDTIYYILLHEFVHYKKRHLFFQWIFWIMKAIYWFNPLVWLAHTMMKHEAELACDEEVMKIIGEDNKKTYGNLLIDLADNINKVNYTVNAAGLLNNKSELKRRIVRLSKKINQSKAVRYVAAILIVIMLPAFFTSYSVENIQLEIVEKIIEKEINEDTLSYDNISLNLNKYEYNTKTEKLIVFLSYEINQELYDKLKGASEMSLYFALQFPGSIDYEIRNMRYSQVAQSILGNSNKGEVSCEFELAKYNQKKYGKAKLVFEGAGINKDFSETQQFEIKKERLPITNKIDDLFSIRYHYISPGKEKNSIDIRYNVESPWNINVHLCDEYFAISEEPLSQTYEGSVNSGGGSGTDRIWLIGATGSYTSYLTNEQWEMTLHYSIYTENADAVIMRLKGYAIYFGMNQAMFAYEKDKTVWRFDITIEEGDIEYE